MVQPCITILLHLVGQLGQLGPVKSTLPEQDVAGVRSMSYISLLSLQNTLSYKFSPSLHSRTQSLIIILLCVPLQAVGPEPEEEEEEEEEDLTERLQALRS